MTTKRKLLARYRNGNYTVRLYEDGTKVKCTLDDEFDAAFPDSVDLKITDYCDVNCPMCHESSSLKGQRADLTLPLLGTLRRGTELAIGGGNPLSHPDLAAFLARMKKQGVVCNLTVNEKHFLQSKLLLQSMLNERLIWGLGVSLSVYDKQTLEFAAYNRTTVLHAICGVLDEQHCELLYGKGLKILLLGYKDFGRGKAFHSDAIDSGIAWLKNNMPVFFDKFDTVCFDNLAIEQLDVRNKIPRELFAGGYMGDDGTASMYIDLVKRQFAVSSASAERYPLPDIIDKAFAIVKKACGA